MEKTSPSHLYGLVDMGSNGIRFSVTDLSPSTSRSLPTVFQDRLGVSLYDAQYQSGSKGPIPQETINDVLAALKRFKFVCVDFEVPETNIRVLATEATRTATNAEDYMRQIKEATGWTVDLLPKEAEGRIGALGVASSFSEVDGLVMDLGGGSTQITWMVAKNGDIQISPKGSFSFPYGAAAMTRKLAEIEAGKHSSRVREELRQTMKKEFHDAFAQLELPVNLREKALRHGLTLYLSGGGFRGWGYLLLSQHRISPYPIPIINGFHANTKDFQDVDTLQDLAAENTVDVFRVSKRRAAQVPAVAFLVMVLAEALPFISDIRFCQGGVREGFLYDKLPQHIRARDPLTSATAKYARDADSSAAIADLLFSAIPGENQLSRYVPGTCCARPILRALADMMYLQSSASKECASVAALYVPITGALVSAHGISHSDRALLALMLCQRWDGELAPPHDSLQARLRALLSAQEIWWAKYIGTIAKFIGDVYPAGRVARDKKRLAFSARWADGLGKKGNQQGVALRLSTSRQEETLSRGLLKDAVETIEKAGKKKNRIGGPLNGYGVPILVEVARDL